MIEVYGNIWHHPARFKIITTNGTVKHGGRAIMGRGVAEQANRKFKGLDALLGAMIYLKGNHVHQLPNHNLISFPVKHNWWEKADLNLIHQSTKELMLIVENSPDSYVMPRPGCGNGKLFWGEVKRIVECLPNNVFIINLNEDEYPKDRKTASSETKGEED